MVCFADGLKAVRFVCNGAPCANCHQQGSNNNALAPMSALEPDDHWFGMEIDAEHGMHSSLDVMH